MEAVAEGFRHAWKSAAQTVDSFSTITDLVSALQCGTDLHNRCSLRRAEQTSELGLPAGAQAATAYDYPSASSAAGVRSESAQIVGGGCEPARSHRAAAPLPPLAPVAATVAMSGRDDNRSAGGFGSARNCSSARDGSGEQSSARSTSSAISESDMPVEEREKEKARLQKMLKEFAKEAVAGIAVNLVNPRTGRKPPYCFVMDKSLGLFCLRPKDGSQAESTGQDFRMTEVESVYKGQEVFYRAHMLGREAAGCVGLDMGCEDRGLILHFDDSYERDKFYTSMQVLILSIGIQQSR
eukprot:TRINITY_DN61408_c0_g1_i1.p1 TRINITY_DN61408_c0_g1~~TRINITY_DN61408_c0_g1_i1.p1  ORF type:complete len:296 (+),score=54.02 TRINITY_DN61408_c0_g1_i1:241-1128(+)